MRFPSLLCCGLLLLLSAGGLASGDPGPVSVSVQLTTYVVVPGKLQTQPQSTSTFSLGCDPTSGTLPFADQVCADIAVYPQAMLHPRRLGGTVCGQLVGGPRATAQITVTAGGATDRMSSLGSACDPGDVGAALYMAAAQQNAALLTRFGTMLQCDEDPVLFAKPTPHLSLTYCMTARWTPTERGLLRLAEQVPAIASLHPATLFPADIGARTCTIRPGITGTCAVYLVKSGARDVVTFAQSWPAGSSKKTGHAVWHVAINGGRAALTSNAGPPQPQI